MTPFRVSPAFVPRVWGRQSLAPFYPSAGTDPIGEVWLTDASCRIETGEHTGKTLHEVLPDFPLLVKILFPDEKLSVQVHPNDADAAALGEGARPKTECWYILSAPPGGSVALGLKPGTTRADVEAALGSPTFEDLLLHQPVSPGDMIYVEAGTVHAIAGGLTLLEVQQPSDTTFRLYDYGRPRDLHLDHGLSVTRLETAAGPVAPTPLANGHRLIAVPHFTVDRLHLSGTLTHTPGPHAEALLALSGEAILETEAGPLPLTPGHAIILPPGTPPVTLQGTAPLISCQAP